MVLLVRHKRMKDINRNRKLRRKNHISSNIFGTKERPRISIFRSNKYIYAQAINDSGKVTVASCSSLKLLKNKENKIGKKITQAKIVGIELGKALKSHNINSAVFDRSSYAFSGRVKALYEGLKESDIKI